MKFKHRLESLKARQAAFDRMSANEQHANTRPGSNKK